MLVSPLFVVLVLVQAPPSPAEEALALAVAKSCGVAISQAPGAIDQCNAVKRARHGWLGLVQTEKGWSLSALLSRKTDGGDPFNGLCVEETTWQGVALKGARLKAGALDLAALTGDESCRLPSTELTLGATRWKVSPREGGKLELANGSTVIGFLLGSDCWTNAAVADLDRDGLPDLVAVRSGGGFTFLVLLSSTRSPDGWVRVCAAASGPPC